MWQLAQPGKTLEQTQTRPSALIFTWQELVKYHDLMEQAFGYDLTGVPVGADRVVPLLSHALPDMEEYPSEFYPRENTHNRFPAFARSRCGVEMDDGTLLVFRLGNRFGYEADILDRDGDLLWNMVFRSWYDRLAFVRREGWFGVKIHKGPLVVFPKRTAGQF